MFCRLSSVAALSLTLACGVEDVPEFQDEEGNFEAEMMNDDVEGEDLASVSQAACSTGKRRVYLKARYAQYTQSRDGKWGKNDAYAVFYVNDDDRNSIRGPSMTVSWRASRTKKVWQTNSPTWNQTRSLCVHDGHRIRVRVKVTDYDVGRDDHIGTTDNHDYVVGAARKKFKQVSLNRSRKSRGLMTFDVWTD